MADPPVADLGGVSLDTLRDLHHHEIVRLRWKAFSNTVLAALAATMCVSAEPRAGNTALPLLLGYVAIVFLLRAVRAGRMWWTVRGRDPVANVMAEAAALAEARVAATAQAERFAARPPYVTWTIAGVLVVIGVLQFAVSGSAQQTIALAGLVKARVAAGEWWRVLTAAFLHGAVWHLYGNLIALVAIGRVIEVYSTRSRLLIAYLAAAVAGNVASCVFLPNGTSIGASGGILGLAGFLFALSRRRPGDVPAAYGSWARMTMILTGVIGVIGYRFIDNAAHGGGALAGFLVGWLTVPRESLGQSPSEVRDDRVVNILGVVAAVVLAATAVLTGAQVLSVRAKPVTSVRVEVLPRSGGGFSLRIQNFRDVPLEAYSIDVSSSHFPAFQQWRDERGVDDGQPGSGPIAPGERRLMPLGDPKHQLRDPSVKIVAALFADGTYEGSWQEYDTVIRRRTAAADDADYWIGVIDEAKTKPSDQVAAFINEKISEHFKANRPVEDPVGTGAIGFALHLAVDTPDRFAADIEPERDRLVRTRDALRSGAR